MERRYHEVMAELIDAVVGGEFAEGDWMPSEAELRERFGASRGVLRDALLGLEHRGLVRVHAGRGQRVCQREDWDTRAADVWQACVARGPDPSVLGQAIAARAVIERAAAAHAAQTAAETDVGLLVGFVEGMQRALEAGATRTFDASDVFVRAESRFHHTLAQLSENPLLAKLVEPLQLALAEVRRVRAPERDRAVLLHHRRIVEGLSARDPELAAEAVDGYARQLARWLGQRA